MDPYSRSLNHTRCVVVSSETFSFSNMNLHPSNASLLPSVNLPRLPETVNAPLPVFITDSSSSKTTYTSNIHKQQHAALRLAFSVSEPAGGATERLSLVCSREVLESHANKETSFRSPETVTPRKKNYGETNQLQMHTRRRVYRIKKNAM